MPAAPFLFLMLYIHIPFCKSRCIYCDFYSTTCGAAEREAFVAALCGELRARRAYLPGGTGLGTVYLGGGTPSQLSAEELGRVMACVRETYEILPGAELTIEANPDDVSPSFVSLLRTLGFNRVSLGVQTFDDNLLRLLHRRHTAGGARRAVRLLAEGRIENLSIDLIYGLPGQGAARFRRDLEEALALPVKHLSAYALTVEEGTALEKMVRDGRAAVADEELFLEEYGMLMDAAAAAGFEHYEISNFALPGYRSRHNSAYWDGTPYLGCGPGAHSYDGRSRRRNLPDLAAYLRSPGSPPYEEEQLSRGERFDEKVFTSLRTSAGLDLAAVEEEYGGEWLAGLLRAAAPHLAAGRLVQAGGRLRLTRRGLFVSDGVMSDLMRAE